MACPDDPDLYDMTHEEVAELERPRVQRTRPAGERFLKGPVPWEWITAAGKLPGRALHVGIVLWHLAGLACSRTVPFRLARLEGMGVNCQAARRGLRALEAAGLVAV